MDGIPRQNTNKGIKSVRREIPPLLRRYSGGTPAPTSQEREEKEVLQKRGRTQALQQQRTVHQRVPACEGTKCVSLASLLQKSDRPQLLGRLPAPNP